MHRAFVVLLLPALSACAGSAAPGAAPGERLALVGVTIVDPASPQPSPADQTILIADGVIEAIGPSATITIPPSARRIDAGGKFAIPGLWDAHVHFMNTGATALPLLLAQGVTSVREMGGYIDSTRAWQARMQAGTLVGPRIVTPGPMLESPQYLARVRERSERGDGQLALRVLPYRIGVGDSAAAARAIDSLVKLRVDFVKVRNSGNTAALLATIREARRAGLQVAAHQIAGIPLRTALEAGQADLEHAILPPLSRLSDAERDSVYRIFVANQTWYAPTLVVSHALTLSGDSASRAIFGPDAVRLDERRAYASSWLLGWWRTQVDERAADTSAARAMAAAEAYRSSAQDVGRMHALGVRILAGSDAGSVLMYPGFSLHEELALLVQEAGLSPRSALWSATVGPATFARLEGRLGTVAVGRIADLVLLDADPLADIRNTRRIDSVVQGGRLFTRADLDALLSGVRRDAGR